MPKSQLIMKKLNYTDRFNLKGKTAIVTGGAGILGTRFCSGLAEFGANVAVVDLNQVAAKDTAKQLAHDYKIKTLAIGADISIPKVVKNIIKETVEKFGGIHILHNNAATKTNNLNTYFASFEDYSLDTWREVMAVNVDAMFLMAQAVGKQMIHQGRGGSIIQTASIYGIMAPDPRIYEGSHYMNRPINTPAVYSASKAAVVGLTKYLAAYWANEGIRVNTLTPGGNESGQNAEFKRRYSARIPMGRMGQPDEMVGALIYLASEASSYVTGQNIIVDGGLDAW